MTVAGDELTESILWPLPWACPPCVRIFSRALSLWLALSVEKGFLRCLSLGREWKRWRQGYMCTEPWGFLELGGTLIFGSPLHLALALLELDARLWVWLCDLCVHVCLNVSARV